MDIQQYKRHDKPYQYIAARLGGPFDPLPSWFQRLEKTGMLRYDDERNVQVRTITGDWRYVEQGNWVVLQRAALNAEIGFDKPAIWLIEHEDFIKLWVML